jgi:hypothetical protein
MISLKWSLFWLLIINNTNEINIKTGQFEFIGGNVAIHDAREILLIFNWLCLHLCAKLLIKKCQTYE